VRAGQLEYSGSTRALAEKVSDAGYGGQIMVSETTSQHIYSRCGATRCCCATCFCVANCSLQVLHLHVQWQAPARVH
jgi:hypothetical protein